MKRTHSLCLFVFSTLCFLLLPQSSKAESQAWLQHLNEKIGPAATPVIETGCYPKKYSASPQTPFKGIVILLHGHSSCPQQFNAIAPRLATEGFTVYTPLLPGPGPIRLANGEDDLSLLPDYRSWQKYIAFSDWVARLALEASKEAKLRYGVHQTVLTGVSLGGALTLYTTSRHPEAFTRQLIVTPLFEFLAPGSLLANPLSALPGLQDLETGWGEPCLRERALGRAGLCQFKVRHAAGAQQMGQTAFANKKIHLSIQTQIVGVENDPYVSNQRIEELMEFFDGTFASSCFYKEGTNHSPFSRFDTPWEEKFWLTAFEQSVIQFVTHGTPFAEAGASQGSNFLRCRI